MTTPPFYFTGERVVPWADRMRDYPNVLRDHLARYTWATMHCVGAKVLDLACGTGYGTQILSFMADDVVGVDIDNTALDIAARYFRGPNLRYAYCDLTTDFIPMLSGTPYDAVTAFECLEHLEDPARLINRLSSVLRSNGVFMGSMPINDPGQFHRRPYSIYQIKDLIRDWRDASYIEFFWQFEDGSIHPARPEHEQGAKYVLWKVRQRL